MTSILASQEELNQLQKDKELANLIYNQIQEELSQNKRLYLAYGSNLNINQMMFRCPKAKFIMTNKLSHYKLTFRNVGRGSFLNMEYTNEDEYVIDYATPVVIYSITEEDEKSLDTYECYPDLYTKENLSTYICINNHTFWDYKIDCFYYIMTKNFPYGKPSQKYINTCMYGYYINNFDYNILDHALNLGGEI